MNMVRFFQPKKKIEVSKKHQSIDVIRLDHHGDGIAYKNRKPIFIEGALPNETVVFQFIEDKSKYSRGRVIKRLTTSEERVSPFCPNYERCGGCHLQHLEHRAQIKYKQDALMQLMHKLSGSSLSFSSVIFGKDKNYRRRARFSLHWNKKEGQLFVGFRKGKSQDVVDINECPILDNELNSILEKVKPIVSAFSQPEKLGHIELIKADNGTVLLIRHVNLLSSKDREKLIQFAKLVDITVYLMPESGMVEKIVGNEPYYLDAGYPIYFQPNHFIQVNKYVNQEMVNQVIDWLDVSETDRLLDLFCGGGNFSIPLAKKVKMVIGVEGVDAMVNQAKKNAEINDVHNAFFYQADLENDMSQTEWGHEKFDKILLDPARSGAKGVIEQCSLLGAQRVVYVSCNPATLARDSHSLLEQGYKLEKLAMLDMFPHTSHLESMALFVK